MSDIPCSVIIGPADDPVWPYVHCRKVPTELLSDDPDWSYPMCAEHLLMFRGHESDMDRAWPGSLAADIERAIEGREGDR